MPLAATLQGLKAQLSSAFNMQQAGNPDTVSLTITSAIAAVAPSGLFPPGPTPIPLVPGGFSATQAQIKNALSLGPAATPDSVAQIMAAGISVLCPTVLPTGLPALIAQLKNAFSLDVAGNPDTLAGVFAAAVISYYTACGVV